MLTPFTSITVFIFFLKFKFLVLNQFYCFSENIWINISTRYDSNYSFVIVTLCMKKCSHNTRCCATARRRSAAKLL